MRVVCTVVAALWLAVVASTATEIPPGRCCPSRFVVHPNPPDYHFRCAVANLTDGCDNVTMTEIVPDTRINSEGETLCYNKTYLMSDWNWMGIEPFEPNIACAYYLPPVECCCWEVWLVKDFDPIVCGDNCQCDCEDNVCFEEGANITRTYCDFDGGTPQSGWCWPPLGPHNVHGTVPFFTAANTGLLTTFRSDGNNGTGDGAFVFASAVPCILKSPRHGRSPLLPGLERKNKCRKESFPCNIQTCDVSRGWYKYLKTVNCITSTLYAIFTDETGRTAKKNIRSPYDVLRKAATHAIRNIETFGRPVPTITQLQKHAKEDATNTQVHDTRQ